MHKLNILLLILISLTALIIDCYSLYILCLMFSMPVGFYISPFLVWFLWLTVPIFFIYTIIGLFKKEKWAYWVFFVSSSFLMLFLLYLEFHYFMLKIFKKFNENQIFLLVFFIMFIIYYALNSTRRLFKK